MKDTEDLLRGALYALDCVSEDPAFLAHLRGSSIGLVAQTRHAIRTHLDRINKAHEDCHKNCDHRENIYKCGE